MSFPVRKIRWNAVLGTAAVLGLFIYAVQTYYLHHTLKTAQGAIELQVFSLLSEAESKIYGDSEARKHYKFLGDAEGGEYIIKFGEIYNYLNLLDNISVLYLEGRIDRAVFSVIYGEDILYASRALANVSESERKYCTGILRVAEQLKGLGEE